METIVIGNEFKEKYDFRETCFGIVRCDNKILLVKKNNQYSLVGGGVEKDESHRGCLNREFKEESGYIIDNIKELVRIDCYWLANNKYPLLSRCNIYEVNVSYDNIEEPIEKDSYIEWVDINKVVELLPLPYHKSAMEWYINKSLVRD